jgi:hypothetical protein
LSVTAVLITYKRQANLARIVDHFSSKLYISEILIRDNSKAENIQCYGRFVMARKATNETVFFQDDDCVVHNIDEIYETYLANPNQIAFGLAPTHYPLWQQGQFTYPNAQLAMLGWGAFVRQEWCEEKTFEPYIMAHDCNPMFYREADRIFSILLKRRHNPILADVEHLPGFDSPDAMYVNPEHFKSRDVAVRHCLELIKHE